MVHVVLIAALFVSFRWHTARAPQPVVQATIVQDQAGARPRREDPPPARKDDDEARREAQKANEREEAERQQRALAEKKRKAEEAEQARKVEEAKRRKLEEDKARRAEQERTRKAAEEKARKAEEEKRRAAEAKRREDENARRRQAESALKEQLLVEEREREQAARDARALSEIEKYKALIRQQVTRNWSRPIASRKGLSCVVQVKLVPGGEVVQARVVRSSGDAAFDRSVENAVFKSTPLPIPQDKDLFDYFREIEFLFSPET